MNTKGYTPTIGLEVHVELKTNSKMFCGCKNSPHESEPNTNICPVCMAHPGTLPTLNKEAIRHVLKVGVALGGTLATYTEFDRKNYFYPDIPKGYQISQGDYPLVQGGSLEGVGVHRIHLEEDTAKSSHDQDDYSLIDYNRAGVPLMELVTEPVIHNAETAGRFARELQILLRTLGVSDAHMEKGEMRIEANISVSKTDTLGTKTEVKNLNSFKSVERAIVFEINRQTELLEKGEKVAQETRGWDEVGESTYTQRKKETSLDYRYFPDPDLPKLSLEKIDEFSLQFLTQDMPELPGKRRERLLGYGLKPEDTETLVQDGELYAFFKEVMEHLDPSAAKLASNYTLSDLQGVRTSTKSFTFPRSDSFAKLIRMTNEGKLSSRGAKDILTLLVETDTDPELLAQERGLIQENDESALISIVKEVISENPSVVQQYHDGNTNVVQFLVGQGMKKSKGSANPGKLRDLFEKELV